MRKSDVSATHQKGLTVIELAFTISIVGVMFFFALKGRTIVDSVKAVAVSYELQQFQQLVLTYQSDYKQLPGDDSNAPRRWKRSGALTRLSNDVVASKAGDGTLDGQFYDVANPQGEQFAAWRDLRFAGAIEGDAALEGRSALPDNPFGGFYGLDEGNLGQKGGSLCATKIPGHAAEAIDKKIDDGRINGGKLVATSKFSIEENNHFDAPDVDPYNIEKEYIICVPMLP